MSLLATRWWQAPDLIEPVIGFRQWKLLDGMLCSPFTQAVWDDAELHARCPVGIHDRDDVPVASCSCGVHTYDEQCPRIASVTADAIAAEHGARLPRSLQPPRQRLPVEV